MPFNNVLTVTLSELGEFSNGVNFNKEAMGRGWGLINVKDIFRSGVKLEYSELDHVDVSSYKKISQYTVAKHDLFFVRSSVKRDGIGLVSYSPSTEREVVHCGFIIRFRVQDRRANPVFLAYALRSSFYRETLKSLSSGTAIVNISQAVLGTLPVELPNEQTQQRITDILSAYDDLIERNTRRIKILEQMAQMLYREWFVNFRFPGHENHPLIESTLGEIPKGWQVSSLGDVTTKIGSGATPRGGKKSYQREGISLIRSLNIYDYRFEMADLAFINDEQAKQLDNVTIEPNDVLLNITGASVGRCTMVPSFLLPARVNQHVAIVRAKSASVDPFFLLDTINNDRDKQRLLGIAQGGATREALTKDSIAGFPILLPPLDLIRRYGQIAGHFHTQREQLYLRIENLRTTRDLLLPKLVSGEVSVEQIEKEAVVHMT
jgi:type I restriction enzyme S subunit